MILFLQLATLHHPGHIEFTPRRVDHKPTPHWRPWDGSRHFYGLEFVDVMGPYLAATEIVVTDWGIRWPDVASDHTLPPELRSRMIDSLWLLELENYRSDLANLYDSIQFWLEQRRPDCSAQWICIDENYHGWPEQQRNRLIAGGGWMHPELRQATRGRLRDAYARAGIFDS